MGFEKAVEYALDKETITKALGFGLYRPLKTLPPPGEWGYDPNYDPRPYNPEKAKKLLSEAGYPNGLKAKLLVFFTPDYRNAGTAIKQYLDDAGFQIELDVADPGRFELGPRYAGLTASDWRNDRAAKARVSADITCGLSCLLWPSGTRSALQLGL